MIIYLFIVLIVAIICGVVVYLIDDHEHEWTEWREGRAIRNRDSATAPAQGRECIKCSKLQVRAK
jgi:hypothetical protein